MVLVRCARCCEAVFALRCALHILMCSRFAYHVVWSHIYINV